MKMSNEYLLTISRLSLSSDFQMTYFFPPLDPTLTLKSCSSYDCSCHSNVSFYFDINRYSKFHQKFCPWAFGYVVRLILCCKLESIRDYDTIIIISPESPSLLLNYNSITVRCCCSVTKSYWTLCKPWTVLLDCSPPGSLLFVFSLYIITL